jgi:hypothetical protein
MGRTFTAYGETRNAHKILVVKSDGKRLSEDQCADERIILKQILGTHVWRTLIGFIWLRTGTSGGLL